MKKVLLFSLMGIFVLSNNCLAKIPIKNIKSKITEEVNKVTTKPKSSSANETRTSSETKTSVASRLTPSNSDNISGLKSSLNIGIEKAVEKLGVENGFYNDSIYKLVLPPEAQPIISNIKYIPGGKEMVDKTTLTLNRTAEDAVKVATPIFKTAITNMSITDATAILFGKDNAATEYLRQKTYAELTTAFAPKVKASLDKPLVANISTNKSWETLSKSYNKVADSAIGKYRNLKTVNANMEKYVTEKALDALFAKIAEQEKVFRKDPKTRTTDLLKTVFGQLDKK